MEGIKMKLPLDFMVKCPRCDSDDIFTLQDTPITQLPVRAARECRKCKCRFYTKFDKYTADVRQLAEATTYKVHDAELWSGYFIEGIYDTREEAVQEQLEELTSEYTDN